MSRTTELDPKAAPAAGSLDPSGEAAADPGDESGVEEELLIEEISIDGMCGVY
ncbi:MAG: mycofactocin precursor MftA [bacterium]|nr:mycofactocin precursor MftA [bacterium]